ncbi:ABC transporter ATP-binding protein [Treponema phagedenis]|uniref:ABC transporter ATP-binding protein n=1 Tax=Treponema phagedenis TaxID=162 RepID=A0A0B7GZ22_TREPH|nr:ABC transporter ATP-binding protein [Treponema phagedenis]EFW37620.1 ABC transporter, ATP-binding protein [Treponema phagedenis F0421]NVP22786.1 ABC transporter ATP-binding protein [Treponema phagedenis]QEJ95261.1 ABC transporter ATP-binding protein [Treponema phagedenis]QEJ98364.1 ABC transporter ATP-binding protein [Treponema phagedenis]QEK01114.1 ABC transporter ATP-binding protein [Treponema phagedenis]
MNTAIELEDVNFTIGKNDKTFSIKDVSFSVPQGTVMGLIGENGAGKTTLIHLLLSMYFKESGSIKLFEEEASRENIRHRDKIGVVLGWTPFYFLHTAKSAGKILSKIYSEWDDETYQKYLALFKIPEKKRITALSAGTLVKLQLAMALSHKARLLILDEPMNNLDPVARRYLIDVFLDFMQTEEHAILISSHLTNDLEKLCDAVTFIHEGQVLFSESMDNIADNWGVLKIDEASFKNLNRTSYLSYIKTKYAYEVLVNKKHEPQFSGMTCENARLEDIMYFYAGKGEH